jgi:small subunit ribosomal protein S3Ae
MVTRRVSKDTWKQKKWYKVLAPTMFGEAEIGETPAGEASRLIGRRLQATPRELLPGSKAGSKLVLDFEVESVSGQTAKTRFHSLELMRSYVRSMVRRRISRIDPIFSVDTKDAQRLRIKALLVTSKRVRTSIKRALRKETERIVSGIAKEQTGDDFIKGVAEEALTRDLKAGLHRIYPLKRVEIRRIETPRPPKA